MSAVDACDACLRRSRLVAFLAADVERLVPAGAAARTHALEVADAVLLDAVPERRRAEARAFLRRLSPARERRRLAADGVDAACAHSDRFPAPLRDLRHPPPVLYATQLDLVARTAAEPAVAVIGSRRPSEYGRTVAYALGRGLGAAGVPVVSGLALGIDALAHRGFLDVGGTTYA